MALDWRNKINLFTSQEQGSCSSCSSFALAATIEANWLIKFKGKSISVSAGFIHTCLGGYQDHSNEQTICNRPVDVGYALRKVQSVGFVLSLADDYPYDLNACHSAKIYNRIQNFIKITNKIEAINYLTNNGPLVADMFIWKDFDEFKGNVYIPNMQMEGPWPHCVCVIGYDATGWIIKNSFGPDWGDGTGCTTIPFGTCGLIEATSPPSRHQQQSFTLIF